MPDNIHYTNHHDGAVCGAESTVAVKLPVTENPERVTCEKCRRLKGLSVPARREEDKTEQVNHPAHYGGADNPYEVIKVIEAWELGFNLGNAVKYIGRAGRKGDMLTDLKKASFYLSREIENIEKKRGTKS